MNLDPRIGTDAYSAHLDGLIFSSLVAHDAQMNIVPDLAERWETPDALTYVFYLRPGVNFTMVEHLPRRTRSSHLIPS